MATLKDFRDERLRKLEELKKLGVNPYPAESSRTNTIHDINDRFSEIEGSVVTAVGRITSIRKFGKIAFVVIRDYTGHIQLFLQVGILSDFDKTKNYLSIKELPLLDTGDFVEATGKVVRTKSGEVSIETNNLKILAKALRPMPSSIDGFTNKEERMRRRYIDMNINRNVRDRFVRRSKFWQATRDYLNQSGFIEINVPVLEHTTGGADATPFITHMDALDQDFYLRISHELPLKRLLGAGFEKVYDIGPRFRNENYSDEHLPEHIAMEWYWAYANWQDGMKFMEDMFRHVLDSTFGTFKFHINDMDVDMNKAWEIIDYATIIKDRYDIDVYESSMDDIKKVLADNKLDVEQNENRSRSIDKLWKNVRKSIVGPAWLINTPKFISPLAKSNPGDDRSVQRFQPIIAGSELGNAFSELNDPIDQLNRFIEQQKMRDTGDDEAMMLDIDFVEMLEYGMPPACGWGYSERVFWIFEGVTAREGVPFPQLRAEETDETTKVIYPEIYAPKTGIKRGGNRPQDFSKRIVVVVNKDLESWRVTNAVAHMSAIIGNMVNKDQLVSGDYFVSEDGKTLPRNTQYPIIIMRADEKELHKIYTKVCEYNLKYHVFIKEMQDTTDDQEIISILGKKTLTSTEFYGVAFFAPNDIADGLTKNLQLWQ